MIVKDKGHRKRRKFGRKAKDLSQRKWCAAYGDAARKMLKSGGQRRFESESSQAGRELGVHRLFGEVGYTTERIGAAGKALSETDAGGGAGKRKTRGFGGLVEDRSREQSKATEKYCETIFEEMRELEEKKSKEALVLVQKNTCCHDVKVKGRERESCKGWEGRERGDIGLTLETPCPLNRARLTWRMMCKKCARRFRGRLKTWMRPRLKLRGPS